MARVGLLSVACRSWQTPGYAESGRELSPVAAAGAAAHILARRGPHDVQLLVRAAAAASAAVSGGDVKDDLARQAVAEALGGAEHGESERRLPRFIVYPAWYEKLVLDILRSLAEAERRKRGGGAGKGAEPSLSGARL